MHWKIYCSHKILSKWKKLDGVDLLPVKSQECFGYSFERKGFQQPNKLVFLSQSNEEQVLSVTISESDHYEKTAYTSVIYRYFDFV